MLHFIGTRKEMEELEGKFVEGSYTRFADSSSLTGMKWNANWKDAESMCVMILLFFQLEENKQRKKQKTGNKNDTG